MQGSLIAKTYTNASYQEEVKESKAMLMGVEWVVSSNGARVKRKGGVLMTIEDDIVLRYALCWNPLRLMPNPLDVACRAARIISCNWDCHCLGLVCQMRLRHFPLGHSLCYRKAVQFQCL